MCGLRGSLCPRWVQWVVSTTGPYCLNFYRDLCRHSWWSRKECRRRQTVGIVKHGFAAYCLGDPLRPACAHHSHWCCPLPSLECCDTHWSLGVLLNCFLSFLRILWSSAMCVPSPSWSESSVPPAKPTILTASPVWCATAAWMASRSPWMLVASSTASRTSTSEQPLSPPTCQSSWSLLPLPITGHASFWAIYARI